MRKPLRVRCCAHFAVIRCSAWETEIGLLAKVVCTSSSTLGTRVMIVFVSSVSVSASRARITCEAKKAREDVRVVHEHLKFKAYRVRILVQVAEHLPRL